MQNTIHQEFSVSGWLFKKEWKEKNWRKKGAERKKSEENPWARSAGEVGEWAYKQVTEEERRLETNVKQ